MASSRGEDASKDALRESYIKIGIGLSPSHRERLDADVRMHLRALPEYRRADLVLAYVAFHEEMDTSAIVRSCLADGKRVALPRCVPGPVSLEFYEVDGLDGLAPGARGVLEPRVRRGQSPLTSAQMVGSICLVPGLVYDAEGHRIGYGAGYYDNFLRFYPGTKVGLARTMQVSSNPLPHDGHDVPVDVIVSDGAIWRCRRGIR